MAEEAGGRQECSEAQAGVVIRGLYAPLAYSHCYELLEKPIVADKTKSGRRAEPLGAVPAIPLRCRWLGEQHVERPGAAVRKLPTRPPGCTPVPLAPALTCRETCRIHTDLPVTEPRCPMADPGTNYG